QRPALHRLHGDGHGGLAGDDQDRRGDLFVAQAPHQLVAIQTGQLVVGDDQADSALRDREARLAVGSDDDLAALGGHDARERLRLDRVVLHDQHPDSFLRRVSHHGAPGSKTVKVAPWPGLLSTRSCPPCWWTISRVMTSPRPVPVPFLPVKKGVYRSERSCGEMPGPWSATETSALERGSSSPSLGSGEPSTSMRGRGAGDKSGSPRRSCTVPSVPLPE